LAVSGILATERSKPCCADVVILLPDYAPSSADFGSITISFFHKTRLRMVRNQEKIFPPPILAAGFADFEVKAAFVVISFDFACRLDGSS
jgi:hypothetical protein